MQDTLRTELTELVRNLLGYEELQSGKDLCRNIYDLLMSEFEFDLGQGDPVKTHFGMALDPRSTARTLMLPNRNRKFLQAVLKALDQNINVLYLGSGAFAPFFLFPLLLGKEAKFTLVEISDYSIGILKKVIDRFHLSNFVLDVVKADAALWKVDRTYELVIGGVNDVAMRFEDSFEIHKNIKKQLPSAQYIPRNIHLHLKQKDVIIHYDSLLMGLERGFLRTDCPYSEEFRPILMTEVEVDNELILKPEESVITGSTYFYPG